MGFRRRAAHAILRRHVDEGNDLADEDFPARDRGELSCFVLVIDDEALFPTSWSVDAGDAAQILGGLLLILTVKVIDNLDLGSRLRFGLDGAERAGQSTEKRKD